MISGDGYCDDTVAVADVVVADSYAVAVAVVASVHVLVLLQESTNQIFQVCSAAALQSEL